MYDFVNMLVFLVRLSYTPPEILFPWIENRGDYTKATMVSNAHHIVKLCFGGNYADIPLEMAGKVPGWRAIRDQPVEDETVGQGVAGLMMDINTFGKTDDDLYSPPPSVHRPVSVIPAAHAVSVSTWFPPLLGPKWKLPSHGFDLDLPLRYVAPKHDAVLAVLDLLPPERRHQAQSSLLLPSYSDQAAQDRLDSWTTSAFKTLAILVQSTPAIRFWNTFFSKHGFTPERGVRVFTLLFDDPLDLHAARCLLPEADLFWFLEFILSLAHTHPSQLPLPFSVLSHIISPRGKICSLHSRTPIHLQLPNL